MHPPFKIAIAQISMHWTTAENVTAIGSAMTLARSRGAQLCSFSELAVTGLHRKIVGEARPEIVGPAIEAVRSRAAALSLAVAVGAPAFTADGSRFISHFFLNERGQTVAQVSKRGLTDPEATFFARGSTRPVAQLQGLRCSAVICREVSDLEQVTSELPPGTVDLVFVPGGLRQDPEKPIDIYVIHDNR